MRAVPRGFTLIELVLVVVIMGILAGAGASLVADSLKTSRLIREREARSLAGRVAVDRIARDMRLMSGFNFGASCSTPATCIAFVKSDGTAIEVKVSGTNLNYSSTVSGSTVTVPLARNVSALSFQYFDAASLPLSTATLSGLANTRFIYISLRINQVNQTTELFESQVGRRT